MATPVNPSLVLIVDDDARFASSLGTILEGRGYRLMYAQTEQQAVRILDSLREQVDLVIVDLVLRTESGFQLIGALRRRPNSIKIIAVSGVFRESELYLAHRVGADAVLRKPPGETLEPREEWLSTITNLVPPRAVASTSTAGD